jgi:hypothetical protein
LKKKFQKIVELGKVLQPTFHNYELNRTFHLTFAFYKKKCISIGVNSIKTHPNIKKLNYMSREGEDLRNIARMHSELNCVLKLQKKIDIDNFKNIVFVNIRLDKMGNLRYAKPCNGCSHLMKQTGYKKFYYSGEYGDFIEYDK